MSTPITETPVIPETVVYHCPLCGIALARDSEQLLCPECAADQAEKWADYCAEREQAWHPI